VIVPSAAPAAVNGVPLFGQDQLGPFFCGPDSGHEPGDSGTDTQHIRFDPLFPHDFLHSTAPLQLCFGVDIHETEP
jgi:hypothetical protein